MLYFIERPEENYYAVYNDTNHTYSGWYESLNECINETARPAYVYNHLSDLIEIEEALILCKAFSVDQAFDQYPEHFI